MAHLYPHLRVHQVFGANTGVGKTIFTTALCLASSVLPLPSRSTIHEHDVQDCMQHVRFPRRGEAIHYLKPVSTGPMTDSDDGHVSRFTSPASQHTILRFPNPVSPHLAARLSPPSASSLSDNARLPTDAELVRSIGQWISAKASASLDTPSVAFVETAGGPHSPSPTGTSQVHLLRPLRLPTILIGDSNLGGISTTRSAYESLVIAGHKIDAVLLFNDDKWGNAEYLIEWGKEMNVPVYSLAGVSSLRDNAWGGPPPRAASLAQDEANMRHFYRGLLFGKHRLDPETPSTPQSGVVDVVRELRRAHHERIAELETYAQRTRDSCWWPTTQHTLAKCNADVTVIDSAYKDFFSTFDAASRANAPPLSSSSLLVPMLDGSASWWTQALGHSHPRLALVAAEAAGRYGHVLFPMAANEPALKLAEGLLGRLPEQQCRRHDTQFSSDHVFPAPGAGWADRVFYSDDGSTGMEVALKMAIAAAKACYSPDALTPESSARTSKGRKARTMDSRVDRGWKILGVKGSYHGDTIGAMDASEPSVYSNMVPWYRGRGAWIDPPEVGIIAGQPTVRLPSKSADSEFSEHLRSSTGPTYEYGSIDEIYNVEARITAGDPLHNVYRNVVRKWLDRVVRQESNRFGALLLEPMVLGAAGMVFVDPLFQRTLIDVVRDSGDLFALSDPPFKDAHSVPSIQKRSGWKGLPVIFDEVFAGLYRLGPLTPSTVLGVYPDVSCLAKILTGGLVPLSVTLASKSIYETFLSAHDRKEEALLHGHSYTAHPIGCEVARETLRTLAAMDRGPEWADSKAKWSQYPSTDSRKGEASNQPSVWSFWSPDFVHSLSARFAQSVVAETMALGTVLVVKLRETASSDGTGGYSSKAAAELVARLRTSADVDTAIMHNPSVPTSIPSASALPGANLPFRIHARPLGNVVYVMSSLNTPEEVRSEVQRTLWEQLLLEEEKRLSAA